MVDVVACRHPGAVAARLPVPKSEMVPVVLKDGCHQFARLVSKKVMNLDVGSAWRKLVVLMIPFLFASCSRTAEKSPGVPQRVLVEAQLDAQGKVTKLTVIEGDRRLRQPALDVARTLRYPRDCDEGGHPIPSSEKVSVYFGANGKVLKTQLVPRVGGQVKSSRLRQRVEPEYPKAAKRARIQGMVLLKVWIDKEGNPITIEPVRGHELLIHAAIAAVKKWKWAPTYMRCEPIPVIATVTVNFVLR